MVVPIALNLQYLAKINTQHECLTLWNCSSLPLKVIVNTLMRWSDNMKQRSVMSSSEHARTCVHLKERNIKNCNDTAV